MCLNKKCYLINPYLICQSYTLKINIQHISAYTKQSYNSHTGTMLLFKVSFSNNFIVFDNCNVKE